MYGELGDGAAPIWTTRQRWLQLAAALAELRAAGLLRAYHDRSDGGLIVTLLEMAFAGHCGLDVALPAARGRGAGAAVRRGAGRGGAGHGQAMSQRSLEILARARAGERAALYSARR